MNSKIFHISFLLFSKKVKNHLVQIVHGSKVKLKDLKNIKAKVMTGEDSSGGPSISRIMFNLMVLESQCRKYSHMYSQKAVGV